MQLGGNSITSAYLGDKKIRPTGITGDIMHYRRDGNYNNSASDQYHLTPQKDDSNYWEPKRIEQRTTPEGGKYVQLEYYRLYTALPQPTPNIGTISFWHWSSSYHAFWFINSHYKSINIAYNYKNIIGYRSNDVANLSNSRGLYGRSMYDYDPIIYWSHIVLVFKRDRPNYIDADLYINGVYSGQFQKYNAGYNEWFVNFNENFFIGGTNYNHWPIGEFIADSQQWSMDKIQEYYTTSKDLYRTL